MTAGVHGYAFPPGGWGGTACRGAGCRARRDRSYTGLLEVYAGMV